MRIEKIEAHTYITTMQKYAENQISNTTLEILLIMNDIYKSKI